MTDTPALTIAPAISAVSAAIDSVSGWFSLTAGVALGAALWLARRQWR